MLPLVECSGEWAVRHHSLYSSSPIPIKQSRESCTASCEAASWRHSNCAHSLLLDVLSLVTRRLSPLQHSAVVPVHRCIHSSAEPIIASACACNLW